MNRKFLKTFPHLAGINKYSERMAKRFLQAYPHWENYTEAETWHSETYLAIKIPNPINPNEQDLTIRTYDEQITVYFDVHHVHFRYKTPEVEVFEEAKSFVDVFLKEEYVVVLWEGGRSRFLPIEKIETVLSDANYIKSWLGTHNRRLRE